MVPARIDASRWRVTVRFVSFVVRGPRRYARMTAAPVTSSDTEVSSSALRSRTSLYACTR